MPTRQDMIRLAKGLPANTTLPPIDWLPITPHASANLPQAVRAIRANTAGTVVVKTAVSADLETPVYRTMNFREGETRYGFFIAVSDTSTATGLEGGV